MWSNAEIIRKGDLRIINFNNAPVQNKITLPTGDRPSYIAQGNGIVIGYATIITLNTTGVFEMSNTNGMVTSGNLRGQIVYTV